MQDIFQSAGAARDSYRAAMDNTLSYMQNLNVPKDLQRKVRTWFTYNWETQKTLSKPLFASQSICTKYIIFHPTSKILNWRIRPRANPY